MKASQMFDGEVHQLFPDEDFKEVTREIVDWEVANQDEVLDPYEIATYRPVFRDLPNVDASGNFPNASIERSWGHFSVAMMALTGILDCGRNQYQHNHYDENGWHSEITFTFQSKTPIEGRL